VYPRKWNHEFIDMPIVEESEQNRPSFLSEIMTGLAKHRRPREQMLFIVSGAGGLRVGEALGIEITRISRLTVRRPVSNRRRGTGVWSVD
jgi:hypothetical protein